MRHATAEETFNSMKAALGNLDCTHSLLTMEFPNVNRKRTKIIKEHRRTGNSNAPNIMVLGSRRLHVIHRPYSMTQKAIDLAQDNFRKAVYSVFKISPTGREDYLNINSLGESHQSKDLSYLFAQKF